MNDIHHEYLKDEHLEEEDQEEVIPRQEKKFEEQEAGEDVEVENSIMDIVESSEKKEDTISGDLEVKLQRVLQQLGGQNEEQVVRLRMSELALTKILVYTHGKSEFRLVVAHHHMGKAYLAYKCYQQAIDHLTLSLKKNAKLTDLKQSKLYHSMMLTTLARCYFEIASYDDALEVLSRAMEIQVVSYKQIGQPEKCHVETIRLTALCHLKQKNYQKAHQFLRTAVDYSTAAFGSASKQVALLNVQQARVHFQQKNYDLAIQQLDAAIEILINVGFKDKMQLIQLEDQLASYYQKNGQADRQVDAFYAKLELMEEIYEKDHKNVLKFKRTIASVLIKQQRNKEAIAVLEEILEAEEKAYGSSSLHVGKTLRMLGLVFMSSEEASSAQHFLRRAQKVLTEQGQGKLVKEVKAKLGAIRQSRQRRINGVNSTN